MTAAVKMQITERELRRFGRSVRDIDARTTVRTATVVRKSGFDILRDTQRATPVDTGRARAAWSAGFTELGRSAPPIRGSGKRAKNGKYASTLKPAEIAKGEQESEAKSNLPRSAAAIPRTRLGRFLFFEVTNNVRHILPIEFGWSDQAPRGMVRITLRRHAAAFREAVKLGLTR